MTLEEFLSEAKYTPGTRTFERNSRIFGERSVKGVYKEVKQKCLLKIKEYENISKFADIYNGRICAYPKNVCKKENRRRAACTTQVRNCDSSWPDVADFRKCHSYSLNLWDVNDNILYKNPHCAKCNFVDVSSDTLICQTPSSTIIPAFTPKVSIIKPKFFTAFSVLFKVKGKPRNCQAYDEIWDPINSQCINTNSNKSGHHYYNDSVKTNCPFKIGLEDIILREDGSVYSRLNNKSYSKEEYELFNDTIMVMCSGVSMMYYYTTPIVLIISLVCLALHIVLYLCFSRLQTWHGRNLFCLCCSLFLAQFLFLTGTTATDNYILCVFLSVCLHYFWLVSFCWMNILSIDIWRTFNTQLYHSSMKRRRVFVFYSLYALGIPFVIVVAALTLDMMSATSKLRPRYAAYEDDKLCWINSTIGLLYFFLLPVGIIIVENFILFVLTSYDIYKKSKEAEFAKTKSQSFRCEGEKEEEEEEDPVTSQKNKRKKYQGKSNKTNKVRFALYLKLGILQGLTWMTGFIASSIRSPTCWYIFTILNGLQGAAIFICFDLKKWVFVSLWERLRRTSWGSRFSSKTTKTTSPGIDEKDKAYQRHQNIVEENKGMAVLSSKGKETNRLKIKAPLICFSRRKERRNCQFKFTGNKSCMVALDVEISESERNSSGNTYDTQISENSVVGETPDENRSLKEDEKDPKRDVASEEEVSSVAKISNNSRDETISYVIEKKDSCFTNIPPPSPPSSLSKTSIVYDE